MIGNQIQNYKIISLLGEGGMGDVFLGEHISIKRKVAIKVLKPELVKNEEIRKRFKNEASMLAHLQHSNIVGLIDYVEQEDGLFLIMEYVDGQDLDELVKAQEAPISIDRAKKLMTQILEAFKYAHQNGIVHRDVKPSNILITADDQIKVLDFGIAKLVGDTQHNLTKTGTQIGTVYYMSPEQVKGKELDQRSDIYSLGVTFYELLSGVCPYRGMTTEYEIYDNIVKEPLLPLTTTMGKAYEKVWNVIERATEKETVNRFQNCEEFIQGLKEEFNIPKQTVNVVEESVNKVVSKKVSNNSSNLKTWIIISVVLLTIIGGIAYFISPTDELELTSTIESGLLIERDACIIDYAFYSSPNGKLLPYQEIINLEIKEFLIKNSFVDRLSFINDTLSMSFLSRLLIDSDNNITKQCGQGSLELRDTIIIDTTYSDFDQLYMSMGGFKCQGDAWQDLRLKIIDNKTSQFLSLNDFIVNPGLFNNIAENCFRRQHGIVNKTNFGHFQFNNNKFFCPNNFYLKNGNFTFYYDLNQIDSGEFGYIHFSVPISEVKHLLKRELKTKKTVVNIAPKDGEVIVEQMQLENVSNILESYYNDIMNDNFDAYNYFASDVKQFIQRKNITPFDINEINQSNEEYLEENVKIYYETINFERINDEFQYWIYWINFSCYRSSRSDYQKCNVKVEVGFDDEGKLISYKELEISDLEYFEYNPIND